jgi:hypothetical protein
MIALVAAVGYVYVVRFVRSAQRSAWAIAVSLFAILVGLGMVLSTIGLPWRVFQGNSLGMAAFAWVALVTVPGVDACRKTEFSQTLLPALAILQTLHAYPVAGAQLAWSSFLLAPVGATCIANGVRGVLHWSPALRMRQTRVVAGVVCAAAMLLFLATKMPYQSARPDEGVPLALEGTANLVVPTKQAILYQEVSSAIKDNCEAFVTLPGMNSFYFWTGQEPPTAFNATWWVTLFSEELQRKVVDKLEHITELCLLRNPELERWWARGKWYPEGPLLRFMNSGFQSVATVGSYQLLKRRER